ncbi:MAG: Uma2 family endonuclease [Chloracidobacterium sp.]|nr:Uma2 family endonuclease [Chloracidobacterium sp.]MDW8216857.1 Uma2 family endonuclease [Acidobacteriota bacterium]
MSSLPQPRLTPAEYLAAERRAVIKSEYVNGEVFAMSGASEAHNLIVANLIATLHPQLKQRDCRIYPSDLRVANPEKNFFYPDVTVVCGPPRFTDQQRDTLLNPTLIIEVLSDSTQDYDRGGKFAQYRKLPSLREYVVVAQSTPHVEQHTRQADGRWLLYETTDLAAVLTLEAMGCRLPLAEIYDKVTFDAA